MRPLLAALLLAAAVLPATACADHGALTVEAGPALTWWPSMPPAAGGGSGINGLAAGGVIGVRYGLSNNLELTASAFYEAEARYTHPDVTVATGSGSFTGTLSSRTGRRGVLAGARYVTGLVLRFYAGAEVGWARQSYTKLDLINMSDPSNPHSFGLELAERTRSTLVLAPLVGVEWQVTDRLSVSCTPKAQATLGGVGRIAVVLPVSVGYSWYGF